MVKKSTKEIRRVADIIERRMLANGVVVQRYNAYSTNSVYFKFDCGVANSLRIGDHEGKASLNYMFLIDVNHNGKRKITRGKFTQYTYAPTRKQIAQAVKHILLNRSKKMASCGNKEQYRMLIIQEYMKNKERKGFWSTATFLNKKSDSASKQ